MRDGEKKRLAKMSEKKAFRIGEGTSTGAASPKQAEAGSKQVKAGAPSESRVAPALSVIGQSQLFSSPYFFIRLSEIH
jgi:hypothetical protein